jgi:hypothetical protein
METKDWITIFIAVWGAGLSTYLGIRELIKERRQIKLILEYITFREIVQLIVVNSGHRPVTITEIAIAISQTAKNPKFQSYLVMGKRSFMN